MYFSKHTEHSNWNLLCVCILFFLFSGVLSGGSRGGLLPGQRIHCWIASNAGNCQTVCCRKLNHKRIFLLQGSAHFICKQCLYYSHSYLCSRSLKNLTAVNLFFEMVYNTESSTVWFLTIFSPSPRCQRRRPFVFLFVWCRSIAWGSSSSPAWQSSVSASTSLNICYR